MKDFKPIFPVVLIAGNLIVKKIPNWLIDFLFFLCFPSLEGSTFMEKDLSLAEYYNIPLEKFAELGVLNPNLVQNTNMFIDPVLLKDSQYEIFSKTAHKKYREYFEKLYENVKTYINLPQKVKKNSTNTLIRKLKAKGIPGLCLGYSSSGNKDNGIGNKNASKILDRAEELFSLDIDENPGIFSVVYMLTEKIGPDYISDMTAQIILDEIKEFTQEIAPKLGLPIQNFSKYKLPKHPYMEESVLLLPEDILNLLPIDVDMKDVYMGYRPNEEIRDKVNEYISDIFKDYHKKKRKDVQNNLTKFFKENTNVLNDFVTYAMKRNSSHYDFNNDKYGFYFPQKFRKMFDLGEIASVSPLEIVHETIMRFKEKIDNNNDIKRNLLWVNGKPKVEKAWQQAFHLTIFQKLEDADFDVVPEYQTGSGPVDFNLTKGSKCRVFIEIKLSKNDPLKGLELQLEKYKKCIQNKKAYFICFNLEEDNQKYQKLEVDLKNKAKELNLDTEIIVIDGRINPSASNLRLNFDK